MTKGGLAGLVAFSASQTAPTRIPKAVGFTLSASGPGA